MKTLILSNMEKAGKYANTVKKFLNYGWKVYVRINHDKVEIIQTEEVKV